MAKHVETLFFFFIALIKVQSQFNPPTYQGDARVLQPSRNISLAGIDASGNIKTGSVGRFLYTDPVQFWAASPARQISFEVNFNFVIKPSILGAAEGVAFFIAPVGTTIPSGSAGGHLGIYGFPTSPSIFAVEFDTGYNWWDPIYRHVGINIQNRVSSNVTAFDAGTGEVVSAVIKYNSSTRTITVAASTASQRAELSYVFDLKTVLPQQVQWGISASTGWLSPSVGLPQLRRLWTYSTLDPDTTIVNAGEEAYIRQPY